MNTMFLIRGIPGSGKSTFAKNLAKYLESSHKRVQIFETDNFFVSATEWDNKKHCSAYKFDKELLGLAHSWNQAEVYRHCRDSWDKDCIVANTFTTEKELEAYRWIAEKFSMKVVIIRMANAFKNVHNVPEEIVFKMESRMAPVDGEYVCYAGNEDFILDRITTVFKEKEA